MANGWQIDPAGANDPKYMNDIQNTAPQATGGAWEGYQQASLNYGKGDYAYWLTQQGQNGGSASASGGANDPIQGYGGFNWATNDNAAAVTKANQARWDEYMTAAAPWRKAAGGYLDLLGKTYSGERNIMDIPGVKARYDLGLQATERRQAAGRYTNSGGAMKELARYGQDIASSEYGAEIARLNTLARMDAPFNPPPNMNAAKDVKTLAEFNAAYAGMGFGQQGGGGGGSGGYTPPAVDYGYGPGQTPLQRDPGYGTGNITPRATGMTVSAAPPVALNGNKPMQIGNFGPRPNPYAGTNFDNTQSQGGG